MTLVDETEIVHSQIIEVDRNIPEVVAEQCTSDLKERLIDGGFYDLATAYQSVHVIILPDLRIQSDVRVKASRCKSRVSGLKQGLPPVRGVRLLLP